MLELRSPLAPRRGRSVSAAPPDPTAGAAASNSDADAVSALVRLGYSDNAAFDAIAAARREMGAEAPIEGLLRSALRALVR
jgi:Holliday junction resolvasome RuvABC DNA-binding subunit